LLPVIFISIIQEKFLNISTDTSIIIINVTKKATDDKPTTLHWTGSNTALTELIYALHSQGIFNNRNATIKPIVKVFESTFNVDLGDSCHPFLGFKSRKINRTKNL